MIPSERTLNFAAVNQTLKKETTKAITSPGILFGAKCVNTPGV